MSEGVKRRDFLKVLGASGVGAATVGCSTGEVERLIPYVIPSDQIVPGVPTWYSSTCRECPAGCGIHVETHEGRVTKVEGNPDHPISHGNLCARGQASVQGLYHPDRITSPIIRESVTSTPVTWGTAERLLAERIREAGAGRTVLLTGRYGGTMDRLADAFAAAAGARRVIHDPWANQPRDLQFADAGMLVSFGADFLETWGSPVDYAWQFAQMRTVRNGQRGKFVWVGPHRPLTGLSADQWIAPRPGTEHLIARALGGAIDAASAAQQTGVAPEVLQQLVTEFQQMSGVAMGPGAALAGSDTTELRAAIASLGGGAQPLADTGAEVLQLIEQMRAGQVEVLLIDAPNPAYTLPAASGFAEALQQVSHRVSFSGVPDETSELCNLILPEHHFLEAWDDYTPRAGATSIVQPAMRPLYNTKQVGDVLLALGRQLGTDIGAGATTYYDYLRAGYPGGDAWRETVRRGGTYAVQGAPALDGGAALGGAAAAIAPVAAPPLAAAAVAQQGDSVPPAAPLPAQQPVAAPAPPAEGALHLVVYPSYRFYDGRTANRPWLLELPDPVTKVPWSSWVELHPATAAELGIEQGDVVEVSSPHGSVETYAFVYPGVRSDVVAIQTGLGHDKLGRWTEGVGVNPNVLLPAAVDPASGGLVSYGVQVQVRRVSGAPRNMPWQAGPGLFEQGVRVQYDREIAQAMSLASAAQAGEGHIPGERIEALRGSGGFIPVDVDTDPASYPHIESRYGEYVEGATRWGMVVDLDKCMGCGACVVACQAENNIPVVGPSETKRGRDLQWLRIERYFGVSSDPAEAYTETATDDVRFLPMLCQHCSNAPCEPVCPVYAAYHTPDGLNGQVYNRCVGTRYCANNCPYKVRVFNWWTYEFQEPLNYQLNPDVTVRDKGVMEKCTFCVQRIREAEHVAARENRGVNDGEVVPACVQTCPTEVFTFGNFADPASQVSQAAASPRGYRALEVLNTQPAIVYLKKVTLHEPAHGGHHAAETAGDPAAEAH